jgi:hypothetical protein
MGLSATLDRSNLPTGIRKMASFMGRPSDRGRELFLNERSLTIKFINGFEIETSASAPTFGAIALGSLRLRNDGARARGHVFCDHDFRFFSFLRCGISSCSISSRSSLIGSNSISGGVVASGLKSDRFSR